MSTAREGVDGEELFRYTSGRWLINEKKQLAKRYVKFDVENLCQRAASLVGASMVSRIDKMEGSFNKALLLTMDDKREVIAKLPCSNAGPPHYTTASEVATLEFSMFPVLHIALLHWSDCVIVSSVTDLNPSSKGVGLEFQH